MVEFELDITEDEIAFYQENGYLIKDRIVDDATVERLREAMDRLFAGEYASGLMPDEVNYSPKQPDQLATRQLCGVWKSDPVMAEVLLAPETGKAIAKLSGWSGTRLAQDNILYKPPGGGKSIGLHQDAAYAVWSTSPTWTSMWIALDDTTADGGTLEFMPRSHKWPHAGVIEQFHAPEDYKKDYKRVAAEQGQSDLESVKVVVPAGGGSFHDGWLWHGSGPNATGGIRRSVVSHCQPADSQYTNECGYVYSRYKRFGTNEMDESFFPILWREDGYRSPFIDPYVKRDLTWAAAS